MTSSNRRVTNLLYSRGWVLTFAYDTTLDKRVGIWEKRHYARIDLCETVQWKNKRGGLSLESLHVSAYEDGVQVGSIDYPGHGRKDKGKYVCDWDGQELRGYDRLPAALDWLDRMHTKTKRK